MGDVHQTCVLLGLLRPELHLVQSLLKERGINSILFDIFQRLEEYIFNFAEVISLDTLHTKRESCLASRLIKADSWSELWSHLTFND